MANARVRTALVLAGLLLATGAACSRPVTVPPAEAPVDAPATVVPSEESSDPEPEEPRDTTSIELPRLPVGGDSLSVPDRPGTSCVTVSWIVDPQGPGALRPGVEIVVQGVAFAPGVFEHRPGSCSSDTDRDCVGYTFSAESGAPACSLAAWTATPGATAAVLLRGAIRCVGVDEQDCAAFVAAAQSTPSQLQASDERLPSETPVESPGAPGESPGG